MLVVLIGVIAVVGIVIYFATASQANSEKAASQPAARRAAEVIEEGFSSESIAYGRSVMDHPMLEREAAKLCEKMEADIRNGDRVWYEIDGNEKALSYGKNEASGGVLDYFSNEFPSKEHWGVKGHDQELGVVWALQHLALAELRRKMPEVVVTNASVESDSRAECNIYAIVRK